MNLLARGRLALRQTPAAAEDAAAKAEADRLRAELETNRLSQRSGSAGQNYQSGRGSDA